MYFQGFLGASVQDLVKRLAVTIGQARMVL